jgi:hypothetical protein
MVDRRVCVAVIYSGDYEYICNFYSESEEPICSSGLLLSRVQKKIGSTRRCPLNPGFTVKYKCLKTEGKNKRVFPNAAL